MAADPQRPGTTAQRSAAASWIDVETTSDTVVRLGSRSDRRSRTVPEAWRVTVGVTRPDRSCVAVKDPLHAATGSGAESPALTRGEDAHADARTPAAARKTNRRWLMIAGLETRWSTLAIDIAP